MHDPALAELAAASILAGLFGVVLVLVRDDLFPLRSRRREPAPLRKRARR